MEIVTIFLIWLAITAIDNLSKRKTRRLPPSRNNSPDFDIPILANDPNLPYEEPPIFIESPQQAEVRRSTPPPKKIIPHKNELAEQKNTDIELNLTPSNVMNAIIFSEILGKPKALRR